MDQIFPKDFSSAEPNLETLQIGIHDCLPIGPGSRSRIPWNQTAFAEIGAVHEHCPELIAAATEAHMAIRWPVRLALV